MAVLAAVAAPAPALARTGPCLPDVPGSATCRVWTGKVTYVDDGDTFTARIRGEGTHVVRFMAVQAMELIRHNRHHRTGQCHALDARRRVVGLVRRSHGRVRLAAFDPGSHASRGRLLRAIAVRLGGRWHDLGRMLIGEGHAIYLTNGHEWAANATYRLAEQQARRTGRHLWDPVHCGAGPQQDVPLEVWVQSDPIGPDPANIDGEWVKVLNHGTVPLRLGHWWVRDAMLRRFTFPAGAVVPAGGEVTLHVGSGTPSPGAFYWGMPKPVFENDVPKGHGVGDGAYLFDPDGDLRAAMLYPCVVACSDPRQGRLAVHAQPRDPESVRVVNVSTAPVDLYGTELALGGSTYEFPAGSTLAPGQGRTVTVNGDWGLPGRKMPDAGGDVALMDYARVVIACDAWGSGTCTG